MKPYPKYIAIFLFASLSAHASETAFETIFDGKTFDRWIKAAENPNSWTIEDGALLTKGPRSHLFFDTGNAPLKNFHLKLEVMTKPGSNGGIFFHTAYQASGWPANGFESQVNVTHKDQRKTGSIYSVADVGHTPAKDNQWWTHEIIVEGATVTVKIDGITVIVYQQPKGAQAGEKFTRVFGEGTIALQAHDPDSFVRYRNIRLKRLPNE